ncbi:MAG TPA: Fe-S cluster assembly protein SufD [Saprospiraceae bacterium]|nr:Fe-S cluster assembly protein SufD [Saprospiraceae bacterium]HMQ81250.1 Fe-S cluster assembly protein SufD [Saprospiraceae bacterium]
MSSIVVEAKHTEIKEHFGLLFQAFEQSLNGQSAQPLHLIRQSALKRFSEELDFPTRRDEAWKYTSVNRLLQGRYELGNAADISAAAIQPFVPPFAEKHLLVFVNGIYQEQLSQIGSLENGVVVASLKNALQHPDNQEKISPYLQEMAHSANIFKVLNAAFLEQGSFVYVPKHTRLDRPVVVLHISTNATAAAFINHSNFLLMDIGSEATVVEGFFSLYDGDRADFTNINTVAALQRNARLTHCRLQYENEQAFIVQNNSAQQGGDSVLTSIQVDLGASLVRNNLSAHLLQSNTETHLYGIYFGKGTQHIDNHTFIDHAPAHCQSNELYKGILADSARGVFNGQVMVRKDAQKTNAFQQNSTLLASEKAIMDAKPQLEIFADDVRCSHGATIGQLDEQAVFYLRTRGLGEEQARSLLQHAFLFEVLEKMEDDVIRNWIEGFINQKFEA